jgi:hypothetical protein
LSEAEGVPLVVQTTPANVPDQKQLPKLLKARPAVQGPRGRPRRNPEAIVGDRAYGTKAMIKLVRGMRIDSALAERTSTVHGSGLGVIRYVIERSLACFQPLPSPPGLLRALRRALPGLPRTGRSAARVLSAQIVPTLVLKQSLSTLSGVHGLRVAHDLAFRAPVHYRSDKDQDQDQVWSVCAPRT